jgi:hypothetical protein
MIMNPVGAGLETAILMAGSVVTACGTAVCSGAEGLALYGASKIDPAKSDFNKYAKYCLIALAVIAAVSATVFAALGGGLLLSSAAWAIAPYASSDFIGFALGAVGTAALTTFCHFKAFNYFLKS